MSKRRFPGIHQLPLVIIKLSSAVRAKTGERQLHYVPNASWESASVSWTKMHLQVGRINPSTAYLWFLSKHQNQCIGTINTGGEPNRPIFAQMNLKRIFRHNQLIGCFQNVSNLILTQSGDWRDILPADIALFIRWEHWIFGITFWKNQLFFHQLLPLHSAY